MLIYACISRKFAIFVAAFLHLENFDIRIYNISTGPHLLPVKMKEKKKQKSFNIDFCLLTFRYSFKRKALVLALMPRSSINSVLALSLYSEQKKKSC